MKIGVLDTDGDFKHRFFRDKKLDIRRKSINGEYRKYGIGFTHGEMVCSMILKENPQAEIILYPIISENMKCSVLELIRGIESLIESGVDIINLSVGDEYNYHPELESICKDAQRQGILIVAAHSNRNVYATYPADLSFVVGVKCIDKNSPEKIMLFDESHNEVIFSSSYFSLYHLEIPRLIQGNSFACAKISGLLSCHKDSFREALKNFIKNDFEIKVSIDGPQFVHDLNRHDYVGNGSYNRIMERLPYLREYEEKTGKTVAYAHVVTKNNYQFFEQSFRFLLDLKADKIESGIDYYCQWEPSEILELKEQIRRTFNLFKEEVKKRGKSFYWNLFEQHLQAFLVPCDFYACKAGLNNVYVATDGNIYTCIELPEFKIGNVNEGLNVLRIREIVNREDKAYQLCKQCDFMSHCKTRGCQASNIEINGNVYQPVEINCQVTKVMYELIENNISKNQLDKMGEELKGKRIYEK